MWIKIPRFPQPLPSEITPHSIALSRRVFLQGLASTPLLAAGWTESAFANDAASRMRLMAQRNAKYSVTDKTTSQADATSYNNFYEFGTDKGDPALNAGSLKARPWTLRVDGEVRKPTTLDIDALLKLAPLEERIYRLRCVEGWSMVIPWIGFPLAEIIKRVEPTGNAKFLEFTTLADRAQMPGIRSRVLEWPYVEGLRLDEAAHPLTLLTVGMYGQVLPQATERRIGEDGFFTKKRKTLMFNGYAEVASLYGSMDLRKLY